MSRRLRWGAATIAALVASLGLRGLPSATPAAPPCVGYTPGGLRVIPWYGDATGSIYANQNVARVQVAPLLPNLCPATVIRVEYASAVITVPHGQTVDVSVETIDHGGRIYVPARLVGTRTENGRPIDEYVAAGTVRLHPIVPNPPHGNPGVVFEITRYPASSQPATVGVSATGEILPPNA